MSKFLTLGKSRQFIVEDLLTLWIRLFRSHREVNIRLNSFVVQWGSEIRTSLDFEWSTRGWVANGLDFEWDLKCGSPTI